MSKTITWVALLFCLAAGAMGQNTTIQANNIAKFGGAKITGSFCVVPTDNAGNGINLTTPSGQQFSPLQPLCFPITNGVLSNVAIVPDTALTQPANACYRLTVSDSKGVQIGIYPCIQPTGSTWNFDAYVPSTLPNTTSVTLPQFQTNGTLNPNQHIVNFIGAGSCSIAAASNGNETITCTGGGSGASNENLTFSATPTFSVSTTSSRIALSGNITSFTLASGSDGQNKCLEFTHDATGNAYTVTPPSNVVGLMGVGSIASKRNFQCFTYFSTDGAWIANSPGVINQ